MCGNLITIYNQNNWVDIITVPPSIIEKIEKFGKSFNQLTLETVRGFLNDTRKSKFKI